MTKIANNVMRGENFVNLTLSVGFGVSIFKTGAGVMVARDVLVGAGKIKVMAGNGTSVVVGVSVGVEEGVNVCEGVIEVRVGDCVFVADVADSVTRYMTAA
jgi:hypothetical protein